MSIEQATADTIRFSGLAVSFTEGLNGTAFTSDTRLRFPWQPASESGYLFAAEPTGVLFDHGWDDALDNRVLGVLEKTELRKDEGIWVQGILDRRQEYLDNPEVQDLLTQEAFAELREVLEAGALGMSGGSVSQLMGFEEEDRGGEWPVLVRTQFPIVEMSLTPTPNNPQTTAALESLASTNGLVSRYRLRQAASDSPAEGSPSAAQSDARKADVESRRRDADRLRLHRTLGRRRPSD